MDNLISIIEEAEKEFDEKITIYKFNKQKENGYRITHKNYTDFFKSHNRQTLLKLVEGIEKWGDENGWSVYDLHIILTELKDKLKQ